MCRDPKCIAYARVRLRIYNLPCSLSARACTSRRLIRVEVVGWVSYWDGDVGAGSGGGLCVFFYVGAGCASARFYLAVLGEAAVLCVEFRRVGTAAVRPRCVARGREGHIANAERVEHAQHAQRAADGVASLDAGERAELLILVRLHDVCNDDGTAAAAETEREIDR